MNQTDDLKVFISNRDSTCGECHEQLGRQAWVLLAGERGALCLTCADLDHLAFLSSGNAALTRRAKKHSRHSPHGDVACEFLIFFNRSRRLVRIHECALELTGVSVSDSPGSGVTKYWNSLSV